MRWIFLIGILISFNANSQCKTYIVGVKGDTLNCTDMKDLRQGKWVIRYETIRGEPGYEEEGLFADGKKEGIWRQYSLEGDLIAVENYKWGNRDGLNQYFTKNGELVREESWRAVNPLNPYDTVEVADWEKDPLGFVKKTVVVKLVGSSVKHGPWKYYQASTGSIEKEENWVLGELEKGPGKKTDDIVGSDPEKKKEVAKPKEVLDFEKKNAGKKKIRVRDGRTGG
ncbi:MAG TPA: hypothetical protein VHL77_04245 [Ferruginibacter sp.]|jgi:hypothetical protein|nr:hypothetical protein [Ferruginibacter sp.]